MASSIDPSVPTTTEATTQSVRDNFFIAAAEISALQDQTAGVTLAKLLLANSDFVQGQDGGGTPRSLIGAVGNDLVVGDANLGVVLAAPAAWRAAQGLGTAAVENVGTVGHVLAFLDQSNTWGAEQVFSEARFEAAAPLIRFRQTGAPVNAGRWQFIVFGEALRGRAIADNGIDVEEWIQITRSAHVISEVKFPNGKVSAHGGLAVLAGDIQTPQLYDAVGDGITDDLAAFTAARAVGKLVFIPKTASGYLLSSALTAAPAAWLPDPTLTWAQATSDGKLDLLRGYFTDVLGGANIWRFADRAFVGEPANKHGGTATIGGQSWVNERTLEFTSGGTYQVLPGDTLVDSVTGATALVISVALTSGSWAAGTAAGTFTLNRQVGAFQAASTLNVGPNIDVATASANSVLKFASYVPQTGIVVVGTIPSITTVTAISAHARSSDAAGDAIGMGVLVNNDRAGGQAWGQIFEVQRQVGTGFTTAIEINVKNNATDTIFQPYARNGGTFVPGMYGLWIVPGSAPEFGGPAVNPSDTAIVIVGNATRKWNRGIVFESPSITGTDGVTGIGTAIQMARGHRIAWNYGADLAGAAIYSLVETSGSNTNQIFVDKATEFWAAAKRYFKASYVASAVNFLECAASVTGVGVSLLARGDDANVDLILFAKGTDGAITNRPGVKNTGHKWRGPYEVTTTDATVTTIATIAINSGSSVLFQAFVTANRANQTDRAGYVGHCVAYNSGAGAVIQGQTLGVNIESTAAMNVSFAVSGSNLLLQVTGLAGTTFEWSAFVFSLRQNNV